MKNALFFLLVLCSACFSYGRPAAQQTRQDSAVIIGKIILSGEKPTSITFFVVDYLLGIEKAERAAVDEEGGFQVKFFIRNTHQVNWRCGERRQGGTLIVSPGDSLTVHVTNSTVKFFGENAAVSEDYYHMKTPKEWSSYHYALDTGYRLEPEEYRQFRKMHYEQDLEVLKSYCDSRNCSELFKTWYSTDVKVRYFRDLMAYTWKSADYGLGSPTRLTGERKEKYNASYLGEIDLDDSTYAMSKWYTFFLNGYSQKVEKRIPFDQVQKVVYIQKLNLLLDIIGKEISPEVNETSAYKNALDNLLKKAHKDDKPDSADLKVMWKLAERYELPLQRAMDIWNADQWVERTNSIPHQNTRELRFVQSFVQVIDQVPNLAYLYEKIYPLITNPVYRNALESEYEKKKQEDALVGNPQGIVVMPRKYTDSANDLLSNIVKTNRNKVIIIDFWATWCAPCLDDFTRMKPIKEKFPADSVSYVYLCSQSSRDLWLKQIKQHRVKGQHYFLSDTQYSEFHKKFGLKAFPSYVIVDAKKRIYKDVSTGEMRDERRFMAKLQAIMNADN